MKLLEQWINNLEAVNCAFGHHVNHADNPLIQLQFIDLGLPSGTLWANMNIGASRLEDFGLYYQWGDILGYTKNQISPSTISEETYKFDNGASPEGGRSLSKYYYTVDKKFILDPQDDAATSVQASSPSDAHMIELIQYCTKTNIVINGINCSKFTSTVNGNSIIIPYSGYCGQNSQLGSIGTIARLWSNTSDNIEHVFSIQIEKDSFSSLIDFGYKQLALPIRPVISTNNLFYCGLRYNISELSLYLKHVTEDVEYCIIDSLQDGQYDLIMPTPGAWRSSEKNRTGILTVSNNGHTQNLQAEYLNSRIPNEVLGTVLASRQFNTDTNTWGDWNIITNE